MFKINKSKPEFKVPSPNLAIRMWEELDMFDGFWELDMSLGFSPYWLRLRIMDNPTCVPSAENKI